jgi:hypothetical protein
MYMGLTGCGAFVAAANHGIDRSVAKASIRECAQSRLLLVPRALSENVVARAARLSPSRPSHDLYVIESPAVASFFLLGQCHRNRYSLRVTKSAGPPSNLCDNAHLDLWRPVPSQLPMNNES